jgi:protein TonB
MIMVGRLAPLLLVLMSGCATLRPGQAESLAAHSVPSCQGNPSSDTTVYDTTQVSRRPEILSGPRPQYPDELRSQGVSGRVVLSIIINADGALERRSIERVFSDHPDFEKSAIQYVRGAVYSPGCREGQAVRVRARIPIDFRVRR